MGSYEDPEPGRTYISPSFEDFGDATKKIRIATKAIEQPEAYAFAQLKSEIVLRRKEGAKSCIKAKFLEDDRRIFVLSIQGYTVATDKPHNASFSFIGDEIGQLVEFINHIQSVPLPRNSSVTITDDEMRRIILSPTQAQTYVQNNQSLFAEVMRAAITKEDVVAIGYRKRQLEVFRQLLEEDAYFNAVKQRKQCSDEAVWQKYFEKNPWIFGHGLSYIQMAGLDDRKLEQVVHGHTVSGHGKRVDALLKTRGVISSLCFVEIKTHKTALLNDKPYRAGCWSPSGELSGAVSQVQGTVARAADTIRSKLSLKDEVGNPTGEEAFNYLPRSFLVVGHLGEFLNEHGVNEDRYRSFELFRRHTSAPEIITFDELYERARFIVHQNEVETPRPD